MDREIKFRYICKDAMGQVFIIMKSLTDFLNAGMNIHGRIQEIIAICQFTSLTDKNGKEIYEGDIIKTPLGNVIEVRWFTVSEYAPSPKPLKGKDLFEYTGFASFNIKQQAVYHLDSSISAGEIIGNIYENPELLS